MSPRAGDGSSPGYIRVVPAIEGIQRASCVEDGLREMPVTVVSARRTFRAPEDAVGSSLISVVSARIRRSDWRTGDATWKRVGRGWSITMSRSRSPV